MPYIVTVKRRIEYERDAGEPGGTPFSEFESRRAVATLEEARLWTYDLRMTGTVPWDIPESGGTIGPLPDGTLIEVERVNRQALVMGAGIPSWHAQRDMGIPEIIAAYNEAQS